MVLTQHQQNLLTRIIALCALMLALLALQGCGAGTEKPAVPETSQTRSVVYRDYTYGPGCPDGCPSYIYRHPGDQSVTEQCSACGAYLESNGLLYEPQGHQFVHHGPCPGWVAVTQPEETPPPGDPVD